MSQVHIHLNLVGSNLVKLDYATRHLIVACWAHDDNLVIVCMAKNGRLDKVTIPNHQYELELKHSG